MISAFGDRNFYSISENPGLGRGTAAEAPLGCTTAPATLAGSPELSNVVPPVGLEPTSLAAADFKSAVYANSTIGAGL